MKLFTERLTAVHDDLDAGFGFEILRLNVLRHEAFDAVQSDFENQERKEQSLATFVDQVSARLGAECLQTYWLRESHVPEKAVVPVAAMDGLVAPKRMAEAAPLRKAERPLRLFNHPEPLEAYAIEVPDGPPIRFRWRRLIHKVCRAEGPERIAGEWWIDGKGEPIRDYFRLESETGQRFWVYRQGLYDQKTAPLWFMHGVFG
jgi:protein ImuB